MKSVLYFLFFSLFCFTAFGQADNKGSGRALDLNGANQHVNLGNIYDNLTLPVTVSAWVYLDGSQASSNPIFTSQDGQDLYNGFWFFVSTTNILMEIGDGTGGNNPAFRRGKVSNYAVTLNQWNHICGVMRSPTDIDLYVNGINVGGTSSGGSSNLPMNSNFPADVAKIGYHFSNGIEYPFKGRLDDVRVYNVALTQAQVRATMCKKLAGTENGLIGYWDFNETSGTTVIDKSPNGFNGVLVNSPQRIYSGAPIGDESVFLYPGNWSSATLTMNEGSEEVVVSGVSASNAGAHIYAVRNTPSQTAGLDLSTTSQPYFGVFIADLTGGRNFDVTYDDACQLKYRNDNSIDFWGNGSLENIINRKEFIKQGNTGAITANLGPDQQFCPFTQQTLIPVTGNTTGYTFLWQDGSTSPTFTAQTFGTYWVNIQKGCAFDRDTVTFTQGVSNLTIDLGEDQVACPLKPTLIQPLDDPSGYSFVWSNGSKQSTLLINDYGKYWVTVSSLCGTASDTIRFIKPEFPEPFIPNVITPNEDNLNEYFVVGDDLKGASIEIFNRWGRKVFSDNSYKNNWNAKDMPTGIYYYVINKECAENYKGWISVVR